MYAEVAPSITVVGIPLKELARIISAHYPDTHLSVPAKPYLLGNNEVHVFETTAPQSDQSLEKLEKSNRELSEQLSQALKSIQAFHHQQQALFDEFVLLREKYDSQKANLVSTLWTNLGELHPDLKNIPRQENSNFDEDEGIVGPYRLGAVLGEGQFAAVCDCFREDSRETLAIKTIKKERITSFPSLRRISTEIATLKKLKSCPHIITFVDVMQTATKLYIVTEKGGTDLFEFFDEHAEGVPESWAIEIISGVMEAVLFCHQHSICHRDLKPENILLKFDTEAGRCVDLKLCDFGLSTEFSKKEPLSDFCGSPGFFAPEMLSIGQYYGDKADVWSTGCILLELVLGHESFCTLWMVAYDYTVMQDRDRFDHEITTAVKRLPEELHFSDDLNEVLMQFLSLEAQSRPSAAQICSHRWFGDKFASLRELREQGNVTPAPNSPAHALERSEGPLVLNTHQSLRERRFFAAGLHIGENNDLSQADGDMHLPPIEPPTPNVGKARKMLISQDSTAKSDTGRSPRASPSISPLARSVVSSQSSNDIRAAAVARLNALEEDDDDEPPLKPPSSR